MPGRKAHFDVTFICEDLDSGGVQRVVSTLANAWAGRGLRVCVITRSDRTFFVLAPPICRMSYVATSVLDSDKAIRRLVQSLKNASRRLVEALGVQHSRLARRIGVALVWPFLTLSSHGYLFIRLNYEAWALRRALDRFQSPIIVSMGTFSNLAAIKACRWLNRRLVISERGDVKRLLGMGPYYRLAKIYYRRADIVTANTRAALHDMQDFVEREKLAFVPNPITHSIDGHAAGAGDPGRRMSNSGPSSPTILIVARLWPEKAHDVLLDAFARMGEAYAEWRLVIAGDGPLKGELQDRAERLGIANRIDWLGAVEDLRSIYEGTDIFVLPSRSEGMPNALLEAMSCSLAVITSDASPGPLDLVEHDVTGLVVPVDDFVSLASALRRLADDFALRVRLGEAARVRVSEHQLPHALAKWASVLGLPHHGPRSAEVP